MIIWKGKWLVGDSFFTYRIHHNRQRFRIERWIEDESQWRHMRTATDREDLNMGDWHGFTANVQNLDLLI